MKTIAAPALVVCVSVCTASLTAAQTPLAPLATNERQGNRCGWAVDYLPGSADGTFGPRTRAAIRSWQSSPCARAIGYLDGASVSALDSSVADQPRGTAPSSSRPPAAPAAVSTPQQPPSSPSSSEVEVVFWQSILNSQNPSDFEAYLEQFPNGVFRALAQNRLATLGVSEGAVPGPIGAPPAASFRPERPCAAQPQSTDASCWGEISERSACYVWTRPGATVTWTGECSGGLARGTGLLTEATDYWETRGTGQIQDGKRHGHWALRWENGIVEEGPYIDGEPHGDWVLRAADDSVIGEGPYVNGKRNGHWVHPFPDGSVEEGPYVDNAQNGHWVRRATDGTVLWEGLYADGARTGYWVLRWPTFGLVEEGPYVDDERHGDWIVRFEDGRVADIRFDNGEEVHRRLR